ncbi:MAG TPA: heavy metal-binding domain-containing protein [Pyrinomonadaceae bacterium]|jgi:hypothetical protein
MRKIFHALAASSLLLTPALAGAPAAPAAHDGHAQAPRERAARAKATATRRRASKARRRAARRAVSYTCPMHPDIRSRARGECPKCGMALVAAGKGEAAVEGRSNR